MTRPHEIDRHVGARLRARREQLGISQGKLGRALGVTFSQLQKYEKGSNRIGAGVLYVLARELGVEPGWFYAGLEGTATVAPPSDPVLCAAFAALPNDVYRSAILNLIIALVVPECEEVA